jgi:putative endopeptidase
VGQDWREKTPGHKANMDKLVAALEQALGQDIQQLPDGAGDRGRRRRQTDAIRNKIGYPENWRDYSGLW